MLKERGYFARPRPRWENNIKTKLKNIIGRHGLGLYSYFLDWRTLAGFGTCGNEISLPKKRGIS
jgi:hypothetical protein